MKINARAVRVLLGDGMVGAELADGRMILAPLEWFPRLSAATPMQRRNWRLVGGGLGIHWPGLDEDVSIEGLLATSHDAVLQYQEKVTT